MVGRDAWKVRRDCEASPTNPRGTVATSRRARDDPIASTSRQSHNTGGYKKNTPFIIVFVYLKKQNYMNIVILRCRVVKTIVYIFIYCGGKQKVYDNAISKI